MKGLFVTFEGPTGVGKTTLSSLTTKSLIEQGYDVLLTKEPSQSELGNFVRNGEEKYYGKVFACLIAADRYYHLQGQVIPALEKNKIVISDRYIESSLVLQQLDSVSIDYIWAINNEIITPDVSIMLCANNDTLIRRASSRNHVTRLETISTIDMEVRLYNEAKQLVKSRGFNVVEFNNDNILLDLAVGIITKLIISELEKKNFIS